MSHQGELNTGRLVYHSRRHLGLTRITHVLIHDADFLPNRVVVLILICDFLTGRKFSIQCGINWSEHAAPTPGIMQTRPHVTYMNNHTNPFEFIIA